MIIKQSKILKKTLVNHCLTHWLRLYLISCPAFLSACASLSTPYDIKIVSHKAYPSTEKVHVLYEEPPTNSYRIIASFSGGEKIHSKTKNDYPILANEAKKLGADAIWIQKYHYYQHPGDWILVDGKMTKIYPYQKIVIQGILIKYIKNSKRNPSQ